MVLKKGSKGTDVKELQVALKELGYNVGIADGDFGPATRRAVKQFQKDYGLSVDGIAGDQTVTALNRISPISSA